MKLHKAVKAWIHKFQQEFHYWESCTQLTAGPTEACCIFLQRLSWPTSGRIWEGGFQGYKTQDRAHFYTWSNHNIIRSFSKPHYSHTADQVTVPFEEAHHCIHKPTLRPQVNHDPTVLWPPVHGHLEWEGLRYIPGRGLKQSWGSRNKYTSTIRIFLPTVMKGEQ